MIREVPIMELAPQGIGPGKVYVSDKVREMMNEWMLERFGVYEDLMERDGKIQAECRSCDRNYAIFTGPEEHDQQMSYCGGSLYCMP